MQEATKASVVARASKLLTRGAERSFAAVFTCVPRSLRVSVAIHVARAAATILKFTSVYRVQDRIGFDRPGEIALHFLLNALTRQGTEFIPALRTSGYEKFEASRALGGGVLVCGPHAALTLQLVRVFYDNGHDPVVITPDGAMRVPGIRVTCATVQPSPTFLVKTRHLFRTGRVVCAMPDRAESVEGRTIEFATATGPKIIAPALIDVAIKSGARIVLAEVHLEDGKMVANIESCPQDTSERAVDAFIDFARRCALRRSGAEAAVSIAERTMTVEGRI